MLSEPIQWERRLCLSFACVLDAYLVRRIAGRRETWLVREVSEVRPFAEIVTVPFCPRCGEDLVEAPRQDGPGEQAAA